MCQLTSTPPPRKRIAVVGGGISGLACAYVLQRQAENADVDVVLFEASDVAGGHALTVDIELTQRLADSEIETEARVPVVVDVGFQVFNLTTYPHLVGFFEELGVTSRPSDMSFGCSMPLYGSDNDASSFDTFEWSSTRNLSTIFPEFVTLLDSRRYDLLKDVVRFQQEAPLFLEDVNRGLHTHMTVAGYLAAYNYSDTFRDVYMLPMIAAIWSVPKVDSMDMPMRTLIRFMVNHHLHKIKNRPKWRTVVDRSRQYVSRVVAQLQHVRLNAAVTSVTTVTAPDGLTTHVRVQQANGEVEFFDDVVLATHTDVSLAMLGETATPSERALLAKIKYQPNRCVLHTDKSIMPANRALWASWNVKEFPRRTSATTAIDGAAAPVCCSYWVNLLQNLDEGVQDVFVTLNPPDALENTLMEFTLSHPALNREAVEAQEQLPTIQGTRHIYFAGAWTRYGFHEDGILSAVHVAELLGKAYEANPNPKTRLALALPWTPRSPSPIPPSRLAHLCLGLFDTYAAKSVTVGTLRLLLPDGSERAYESASASADDKHAVVSKSLHAYHGVDLSAVVVQLKIHDLSMFPRIIFGHSSIAMADAYMDQLFDISLEDRVTRRRIKLKQYADTRDSADDRLAIFLYWCALNLNTIESNTNLLGGPAQSVGRQLKAFYHWQRQFNTIAQAKKHISMHYDLGNDLYELFLDKSMTYSSGMLPRSTPRRETEDEDEDDDDSLAHISLQLEQEQECKLEHAFLAANIQDGHRVLEIGCGWGSMAIYACTHAQCQWTALTLSTEQKAMMEDRVAAAGLSDRIEVLLTDFRELAQMPTYQGAFDRVMSLEMIEALGDGNLPGYFADINRFLKPETGRVLIQAITIPDDRYEQYCKNTDFIKEYIFPGGHLPSRARIYWAIEEGNARVRNETKTATTCALALTEEVEFGKAYASTLRAWRLRMLRNRAAILSLKDDAHNQKYDARFMRMFEWYFAYCEVGFQQGLIHVLQVVIENKSGVSSQLPFLPNTLRAGRNDKIRTKPFTKFESQILTGSVFHTRHDGVKNAFRYDTAMALVNLDDLYTSKLFTSRSYLSLNRANLLAFHRADHFGDPKRTLKSSVLQLIQDECALDAGALEADVGTVFLLTTIRCMGYSFNPISIYYCMAFEDPSKCLYVVLEVTNTPWLEKQCYVLRTNSATSGGDKDGLMDVRFAKEMHVSPFFKMDCAYRIRLNHPGTLMENPTTELRVLLELHERQQRKEGELEPALGKKLFTATVDLTSHAQHVQTIEKTEGRAAAAKLEFFVVCAMAIMAWQALLYIHWQAIKLVVRGQPIIKAKHPAYAGKLRAATRYSADLIKHLFIFAVALIGLGVIKALKYATEKPVFGAAGAAATALAAVVLL